MNIRTLKLYSKTLLKGGTRGMTGWLIMLLLIPLTRVNAQSHSETIRKTAHFQDVSNSQNTLQIYNINGAVAVEGYNGNKIQITAQKNIEANSQRELEQGIEEVKLTVEEHGNHVLIYMDGPFICVKKNDARMSYRMQNGEQDYDFLFDITINVPLHTNIKASTINRGNVKISNIAAEELYASNVNGAVAFNQVRGRTRATTVNGDIRVSYTASPTEDSEYTTINGTIEVNYPEDLSADIHFKSMHGDLYTDFPNLKRMGARVEKNSNTHNGTTTYRFDRFTPYRIGEGGPEFQFEVLNGDVFIKRIKS